jgi:hypothetical protein
MRVKGIFSYSCSEWSQNDQDPAKGVRNLLNGEVPRPTGRKNPPLMLTGFSNRRKTFRGPFGPPSVHMLTLC